METVTHIMNTCVKSAVHISTAGIIILSTGQQLTILHLRELSTYTCIYRDFTLKYISGHVVHNCMVIL